MVFRRRSRAAFAGAALVSFVGATASTALGACNALWGVDELTYDDALPVGGADPGGAGPGGGRPGGFGAGGEAGSTTTSSTIETTTTSTTGTGLGGGGAGGSEPLELVITAVPGLGGDGFLASPDLCGVAVRDYYTHDATAVIDVGRDIPCGVDATYRAFVRFDLAAWHALPDGAQLISATVELFFRAMTSPTAPATLFSIADFGTLDAGDWSSSIRRSLGMFVDPSTPEAQWIARDAVPALLDAFAESHVAFALRYDNEGEDPGQLSRWYDFVAADDAGVWAPRLVIRYYAP